MHARQRARRIAALLGSIPRTRRASRPPCRRSPATPSRTPRAERLSSSSKEAPPRRSTRSGCPTRVLGIPQLARTRGTLPLDHGHGDRHRRGARRLVDHCDRLDAREGHDGRAAEAQSRPDRRRSAPRRSRRSSASWPGRNSEGALEEVRRQNQELLATMAELSGARKSCSPSIASSRTRTAASWRSTPSWTRRPTTCGGPTSSSRSSSRT